MEDIKPTIKIGERGPLIIKGGATLVYSGGREEIKEKQLHYAVADYLSTNHFVTVLTRSLLVGDKRLTVEVSETLILVASRQNRFNWVDLAVF